MSACLSSSACVSEPPSLSNTRRYRSVLTSMRSRGAGAAAAAAGWPGTAEAPVAAAATGALVEGTLAAPVAPDAAPAPPGGAASQPAHREIAPRRSAMLLQRLQRIGRAGRFKPARRTQPRA